MAISSATEKVQQKVAGSPSADIAAAAGGSRPAGCERRRGGGGAALSSGLREGEDGTLKRRSCAPPGACQRASKRVGELGRRGKPASEPTRLQVSERSARFKCGLSRGACSVQAAHAGGEGLSKAGPLLVARTARLCTGVCPEWVELGNRERAKCGAAGCTAWIWRHNGHRQRTLRCAAAECHRDGGSQSRSGAGATAACWPLLTTGNGCACGRADEGAGPKGAAVTAYQPLRSAARSSLPARFSAAWSGRCKLHDTWKSAEQIKSADEHSRGAQACTLHRRAAQPAPSAPLSILGRCAGARPPNAPRHLRSSRRYQLGRTL